VAGTGMPGKDASWTMMGGDAHNTYHNPDETVLTVGNAKDLKQKWVFEVAGFPPGSPVVAGGKVFVMATGGTYAIDFKTGAEIWNRMDITGTASVAFAADAIYVHDSSAQLYKLNAADGTTVWGPIRTYELPTCDGTSSPVVALDKVLVGHSCGAAEVTGNADQDVARGGVEAFATSDGSRAWTYFTAAETGENGAMVWSTVGVDTAAKVVFAATGNNYTMLGENSDSIHAIDLMTGTRVWKKQVRQGDVWSLGSQTFTAPTGPSIDTDFGANPVLADVNGKKLVAAGDKASAFWALDRTTGEILWGHEGLSATHSPANGGVLMNGAFDGTYFYMASNEPPGESLLHVLDPADGKDVVEPVRLGAIVWGAPSLANGLLFVPANSILKVFNAKTLELLTSLDTGGTIAAGAASVVNGNVIVASGLMYVFATDALPNNKIICYSLDGTGGTMPSGGTQATGKPTWSAIYDEIVVAGGCTGSSMCHGGDVGVGSLSLQTKSSAFAALINVKAMGSNLTPGGTNCKDVNIIRVMPGDPDNSLLVKKLEGTQPCGDSMPPGGLKLKDAQLKQVRDWVQQGAQND
jgi:polyvinyl alcohol dehydrogenase (cytochrome)